MSKEVRDLIEKLKKVTQLTNKKKLNEDIMSNVMGNKCDVESLYKAVVLYTKSNLAGNDIHFNKTEDGVTFWYQYNSNRFNYADPDENDNERTIVEKEKDIHYSIKRRQDALESEYKAKFENFCDSGIRGAIGVQNKYVVVNSSCSLIHMVFNYDKQFGATRQPRNPTVYEYGVNNKSEYPITDESTLQLLRQNDIMKCSVYVSFRNIK